jgi:alkylation response protein AidB-like acyl-CoA dehydrogenase
VTIFNQHTNFLDFANEKLSADLGNRDSAGVFNLDTFKLFAEKKLFMGFDTLEPTQIDVLQNYYNIARGSLDLPFTSSLAAHGFVGMLMLKRFGSEELKNRFKSDFETATKISSISNSEGGTSINLKKMNAQIVTKENGQHDLQFTKPCITNGSIANVLMTTIYHNKALELFLLLNDEVEQKAINSQLVGFRTGDTGMVVGKAALPDLLSRRLTGELDTLRALKYCFCIERLIVSVMATGIAHGLEDYIIKISPQALTDTSGDNKQYLQEKILKLHMTRVQMSSLIETIIHRGSDKIMSSESELAILKLMISNELRAAVYSCIEVIGHWALYTNNVIPKVLRDIQMCSFFGGTAELQKISLYSSLNIKKHKIGA